MPVKHLKKWQESIPGLLAMNVYGPTEATVNITYYPIDREFWENELLPLGYPCGNTGLLILDDRNKKDYRAVKERRALCEGKLLVAWLLEQ